MAGPRKDATTTTDRDRKELLQSLLDEVKIELLTDQAKVRLVLRWKTGAHSQLEVLWRIKRAPALRTDEETIDLVPAEFALQHEIHQAWITNLQRNRNDVIRSFLF